jgi:hypothetical protein
MGEEGTRKMKKLMKRRDSEKANMAHNYILQVTAGHEYDISTHQIVPVNSATPITIKSELLEVDLNVRIQVCLLFPPFQRPLLLASN